MKNTLRNTSLLLFTFLFAASTEAQNFLSKQEAVNKALQNNFGVIIGNNNKIIAENSTSILNTGFLPTVNGTAGANYSLGNITANRQDGTSAELNGAVSSSFNASANLNYTLFNGLGRWYNYKQLKEQFALSELEARTTIENAIYQTMAAYFDVAVQTTNTNNFKEALNLSYYRLERANSLFSYGQGNKLAVLNAEVDLKNDSVTYVNSLLDLANSKRNLNAIIVDEIQNYFSVDTTLTFWSTLDKNKLYTSMLDNNSELLQAKKNIEIGAYNVEINRANYLPTISATAQYGWNRSNNNEASFLASLVNTGLSTGATISWNLFDGGSTKINQQNTKLRNENLALQLQQKENNLTRDFEIAWADYQNKLYVYRIQEGNLISNQANFTRSKEQFKLGQVSSLEYRQAQQNLLNAATQITSSKYAAKLAEVKLFQLSGMLMDVEW